jgi:hypothetical protein
MTPLSRSSLRSPWTGGEISQAVVAQLAGMGALIAAWYGSSGQRLPSGQLGWLTLGVAGAAVSGVANTAWLLSARRAIAARRAAIASRYETGCSRLRLTLPQSQPLAGQQAIVAVSGRSLYHRPTCPLVTGRATTPVDSKITSRKPCGWCRP